MISVIILNKNRKNDLIEAIGSIYEQTYQDVEIIIIDQSSNDGSVEAVRREYPKSNIIALDKNLGVAAGRNYGASLARGKYLLFLDNDAVISKNALAEIKRLFESDPLIGAIAFKIVNYYSDKISNWGYPKNMKKFVNRTFITTNFIGCGNAVRKDVFDQVGGFNSDYFFWGEELEFALKLYGNTDYYILFCPHILVKHKVSPIERFDYGENRFYYKVKHKLDIILTHYEPFYRKVLSFLLWGLIYFGQSFRYKALKQYCNAVAAQDYHKIFNGGYSSKSGIRRYFNIRRKMLIPLFRSSLFIDL